MGSTQKEDFSFQETYACLQQGLAKQGKRHRMSCMWQLQAASSFVQSLLWQHQATTKKDGRLDNQLIFPDSQTHTIINNNNNYNTHPCIIFKRIQQTHSPDRQPVIPRM